MIAVDDVGAFAALAFGNPASLRGTQLELAGDELTGPQIAALLGELAGMPARFEEQPLGEIRDFSDDLAAMYELFPAPARGAVDRGLGGGETAAAHGGHGHAAQAARRQQPALARRRVERAGALARQAVHALAGRTAGLEERRVGVGAADRAAAVLVGLAAFAVGRVGGGQRSERPLVTGVEVGR